MQPCLHEQSIGALKIVVKRLENKIFGNGKDGLSDEVIILKKDVMDVKDDLNKLATSYSALAKSEIKKDAIEQAKLDIEKKKLEERKKRSSVIQRLGTIFGIVFGAVTVLYIILDHCKSLI